MVVKCHLSFCHRKPMLEAIRDSVIDAELAKIRERCPALTIIEE